MSLKFLSERPEVAEKVEAFVSRFGRLQDHLGDKLLPRFAARRLRNALVHENMHDAQISLEGLLAAQQACQMFFDIIERTQAEAVCLGLVQTGSKT